MALTKDDLNREIAMRGIMLEDDVEWSNDTLLKKLGDEWIKNNRDEMTFVRSYVHSLDNLMLIKHYKDEKKNFTDETDPLKSPNWIAEIKSNGFRCVVGYSPEHGFEMLSRRESTKNFLNGNFTDKILFIKNGIITYPSSYINTFNYRFIIDCEIMVNSDNLSFDGVDYTSVEDFLQSVLGSLPEKAKQFQKDGCTLYFKVFDVLYFEVDPQPVEHLSYKYVKPMLTEKEFDWVKNKFVDYLESSGFVDKNGQIKKLNKITNKLYGYLYSLRTAPKHDVRIFPFRKRRLLRDNIVKFLQENNLPFEYIETEENNKEEYANEVIRAGGEGVILKNLQAPYISSMKSSRSHKACLKVKSSVSQTMENSGSFEDFDCFISGFNKPKSKNVKDMIGSLKCSVYIRSDDGNIYEHEVANISGIDHDLKRDMTIVNSDGSISLNEKYLGQVIAIDGFSLSHKTLRFAHATFRKNLFEVKSKNAIECTYTEEYLRDMVSIRGV